jgi:hypothetical protein
MHLFFPDISFCCMRCTIKACERYLSSERSVGKKYNVTE